MDKRKLVVAIKKLLAKKKAGKATDADLAKLDELRAKEKELKEQGNDKDRSKSSTAFGPGNDFSWWNKAPELLKDASNLKSNWIAGTPIAGADLNVIPFGVARFEYVMTYGKNSIATDPINLWSRDLYLRMFQKWRGISAYSAADLGIALIAGVEVFRLIFKLERIYGVVNRYSKVNLNMPYAELAALGITTTQADYIRDHLSDYRYDLNVLIRKAQRICVLKDMSVVADQLSLLGYEYLDHDNKKGQIIIFDSKLFGVYSDTALKTGGSILYYPDDDPTYPAIDTSGLGTFFPLLDYMISQLVGSDSIHKIYGDIITWFGDEQLLVAQPLTEDFIIAPVYSEEILHKMHNIECVQSAMFSPESYTDMDAADQTYLKSGGYPVIYQRNDCINTIVHPTAAGNPTSITWITVGLRQVPSLNTVPLRDPAASCAVIDTYRVDPDEVTITEGALWKNAFKKIEQVGAGKFWYDPITYAFELFIKVTLYKMTTSGTTASSPVQLNSTLGVAAGEAGRLSILDWAPLCYDLSSSGSIVDVLGDIDTPIPLYNNTMAKLHTAVVLSGLMSDAKVVAK